MQVFYSGVTVVQLREGRYYKMFSENNGCRGAAGTVQAGEFLQITVQEKCIHRIWLQERIPDPAQIVDDSRDNLALSSNAVVAMV